MTHPSLPLERHLPGVSRLVYGCMGLGGNRDAPELERSVVNHAFAAVDAALEAGINCFDHADVYGHGKAETVFGRVLAERRGMRDRIYLQSKCGIRMADARGPKRYDLSRRWILSSVEGSLRRLGTDYLDLLLLHRPDPLLQPEEIASAFTALRRGGKVRHFGVSNMDQHQLSLIADGLDEALVVNQLPMGLAAVAGLDAGIRADHPEGPGPATPGILDCCRRRGIQLQALSPLGRGVFTAPPPRNGASSVHAVIRRVATVAEETGRSAESVVLAWLLRHPAGIQPVIGTTRPDRLRACTAALDWRMDRETWYSLFEAARGGPVP